MPTWLRNWTFNEINNHYKERNKQAQNAQNPSNQQTLVNSEGKINRKAFKQAQKDYTKTSYK